MLRLLGHSIFSPMDLCAALYKKKQELIHYTVFKLNHDIKTTKKYIEKKAPGPLQGILIFKLIFKYRRNYFFLFCNVL